MKKLILIAASLLAGAAWGHAGGGAGDETVTPIARAALAPVLNKQANAVRVDFAPGATSHPHTHPGHVFAVVLSGEVESALGDQPPQRYKAGDAWYEAPGELHRVTRNASSTAPAMIVAWVLSNGNEPLVRAAPQ